MRFRRLRLMLVTVGLAIPTGGALPVALKTWDVPSVYYQDFVQEWLLARSLLDGDVSYPSLDELRTAYRLPLNPDEPGVYAVPHPPTAGVLFLPFAALDYVTAARLWMVSQLVLLVLALHLSLRIAGLAHGLIATLVAAMIVFTHPITLTALFAGQTSILQLALLAGAVLAARHARNALAGALLGLALAVKPILWLVLPFLLLRQSWRILAGAAVAAGAVAAIGALMAGPEAYVAWLASLARDMPMLTAWRNNWSLWQLGPAVAAAVFLLTSALALRLPIPDMLGLAAAVGAFLGPIAWPFYALLLLVPISSAIRLARGRKLALPPRRQAEATAPVQR